MSRAPGARRPVARASRLLAGLIVAGAATAWAQDQAGSTPPAPLPRDGTVPAQQAPEPSPGSVAAQAAPARGAAGPMTLAERLLADGRPDEAWRMLQARADEFAGDPDFDYLLGLAALDSGRPGQAIFALERVLMARPDFLPARAEIARAYFMASEHENARREFAAVSARPIPEAARRTIGRYLDAIARADELEGPIVSLRAEVEGGYDTNPNFGSASGQWLLADGTAVTPLPGSRPRSSGVLAGAFAIDAAGPVDERIGWTLGARASTRMYPLAADLNQQQLDLSAGLSTRHGCHRWSALALLQHLQLDGSAYRNAVGGLVQWQCELDSRTLVGASVQSFRLDYPAADVRDARRSAIGVNAARLLEAAGRPIVVASLAVGEERSRTGFDNLGHDFASARAGVVAQLAADWRASASLSWERRDFDAAEPIFGVVREDRQTEIRLELERRLGDRTSLVPQLIGTRNESTLSPNDFRRLQAGVLVRHRF